MTKEKSIQISGINLLEKQSTRTTFKLSKECIDSLDWLLNMTSLKPKEFFDIIASDDILSKIINEITKDNLKAIAKHQNFRKTYVISKKALKTFNEMAKEKDVPRDLLVESLISIFVLFYKGNLEKEKEKEEKALRIVSNFWSEAGKIENKLKELLGDEHPIVTRFGYVIVLLMNLDSAIEEKLSNGTPIDPDDM